MLSKFKEIFYLHKLKSDFETCLIKKILDIIMNMREQTLKHKNYLNKYSCDYLLI
jgi:hypothetical protein